MTTYLLPKRDLWAMSLLAAKNDIRYYLNSVMLDVGGTESRLVATDGHSMGVMRLPDVKGDDRAEYIIPLGVILGFPYTRSGGEEVELDIIAGEFPKAEMRDPVSGWSRKFAMIEAKYPEYRRVFAPLATPSNKPAQLNPAYLHKFHMVAKRMGKRDGYLHLVHNGTNAMVGIGDDRFIGLIMGMHCGSMDGYKCSPGWIAD